MRVFRPGRTHWLVPVSVWSSRKCRIAKALRWMWCALPFLVSGRYHTPFVKSTFFHCALAISPTRAMVDNRIQIVSSDSR